MGLRLGDGDVAARYRTMRNALETRRVRRRVLLEVWRFFLASFVTPNAPMSGAEASAPLAG